MDRKELINEIQLAVNKDNRNLVTCPYCGQIEMHEMGDLELECSKCGKTEELCHWSDL